MSEYLQSLFPGLQNSPYRITSPADPKYNCIAWAASETSQWWWPEGKPPDVNWPASAPSEVKLDAFTAAFMTLGYVAATDESLEAGFEKIALFADAAGIPTQAARQLSSGQWTSKLGEAEDIEHELRALEGEIYGKVGVILKRPINQVSSFS
jgi:hypothetical protein